MSATCQITTLSAPLFFRLDAPRQKHPADLAASGGMDLSVNARNASTRSPTSSVPSSTPQPGQSTTLHARKMSSNIASDIVDVSGIVASAGSAHEAVYKLVKEKQALAAQNAQLWNLVQKQRDMVKGLNKDLERALKDKERYREKLKGHAAQLQPLPSVNQHAIAAERRQHGQSPAGADECEEGHSPSSSVSVREMISNGLRNHASSSSLDQKPSSNRKGDALALESSHRPPSLDTLASTSTTSSLVSQRPAAVSFTTRGPRLIESPGQDVAHQTRKAPPAPLNLAKREPNTSSLQPMTLMNTAIAGPSEASEYERGRRKTREDDDRTRDALALRQEGLRSQSQKDKTSKSKTPNEKAALNEQIDNALPQHVELPFGFHPSQGLPTSPRAAQLSPLQPQYPRCITEQLSSGFEEKNAATQPSMLALPPRSPGLPMSPRPSDRPLNSPMPRLPRQPVLIKPMTPSIPGLPMSPRPPRELITLPPPPLLSCASPDLIRAETYHEQFVQRSSIAEQLPAASDAGPDQAIPGRAATPSSSPGETYRGLMSDEYPGLLLSPDGLFSVNVKVSSSRLKPSRNSLQTGAQKWAEEDPVLTLAVNCRSTGKQFWRVEKTVVALSKLDYEIRLLSDFDVRIPDKSLFNGHAPAKVDARRAALDDYLDAMVGYQWNRQAALTLCEFLSTDAMEPRTEEFVLSANSPTVGLATTATKEGYLTKKGKNFGGWKVRYFVLEGSDLRYLESPGGAHLGTIRLQNAQIGKQQQCLSSLPVGREENVDEHFRHAFVVLERKQKDQSSLLRHVLCAESDEERDAWVEAVLQHVEQVPAADGVQITPWHEDSKQARPDVGEQKQACRGNAELLQGVSYENTIAAEAPFFGPLSGLRGGMPSPSLNGYSGPGHHVSLSKNSHLTISAPTNGVVIQDAEAWGNRKEKELKKRSIFGFRGRSSSDSSSNPRSSGQQAAVAQPASEYAGLPRPAFGVPLAEAVEYSAPVGVDVYLPAVVYRCIEYLHAKGAANEEGIFRLSGSHLVTRSLRDRFNNEGDVKLLDGQYYDIHAVASLLKTYLRELPATVLTRELQLEFLKVLDMNDVEDRLAALNVLTHKLPRVNSELLKALFSYLIDIVNNAEVNRMNIRNVGIVFAPTLNINAPLISHFLSDFNAIFGPAIDTSFPPHNTDVTNVDTAGALHPPRRQITPEVQTMSFQSSTGTNNRQIAQAAHSVNHTGFRPWQPTYDPPMQAHRQDGGFANSLPAPAPGVAEEAKVTKRELLQAMGLGTQTYSTLPQLRHEEVASTR